MGKTRVFIKNIRDSKGIFHANMGTIKEKSGMDLTEAEDMNRHFSKEDIQIDGQQAHEKMLKITNYQENANQNQNKIVKAMVFPVVMYGCESWTIKKAEHRRIDAFELWCWRRLLRVPWTARRSNQSILKETSPGCSLEGLMLNLKLQYFGHLM